ncbi:hypothetical protein BVRB_5g115600 [Beta vulgaris subsp. vulgaris]|nr:hypothetical protein BVRB_5g115600 [Beta vulgaris subsp. vulgaris]
MAKSKVKTNPNLTLAKWVNTSSALATLMFLWSILRQYAPSEFRRFISRFTRQIFDVLSPYIELCIEEFSSDENIYQNDDFASIQAYLGEKGSKNSKKLRLLNNNMGEKRIFCMNSDEEMTDKFDGITVWWTFRKRRAVSKTSFNRRSYKLSFHRKNREIIAGKYLDYVIKEGKKIREKNRTRRLFLNKVEHSYVPHNLWTSVEFKHPASFETLAMDSLKKREIIADLLKFRDSEEYYSRIGKAWKRGYLLYGPPGTGKSTMIAAMANLLEYDVYDLELNAVQNNTQLRKLLINTNSRAIIAIEDIDCALNLTGKRDTKKSSTSGSSVGTIGNTTTATATSSANGSKQASTVTLSGLLNFIDGIWSSLGGERIIVFTTNSVAKLDPALIRAGRMDKHIELSYCGFEGFKVLAKNYLLVEDHSKFDVIKTLLEVTKMTPADVAENLLFKSPDDDADICLENLIRALEKAKEDQEAKEAKRRDKKAEQAQLELVDNKDDKPEVEEEEKETSTIKNE